MGTKCAPSYAILFMHTIESRFLATRKLKPLIWWRYIDDVFSIWPYSREELTSFIEALNSFHNSIKFTAEISETTANFLDTTIIKDHNGSLSTTLYSKPTDAHMYLHYDSFHPRHQKHSIPYSQALRIRKICSSNIEFDRCTEQLRQNLKLRGYPNQLIKQAIQKARLLNRDILINKTDTTATIRTIPLIVTNNPQNPDLTHIIKRNKHILESTPATDYFKKL
jgi:hypothetical protein